MLDFYKVTPQERYETIERGFYEFLIPSWEKGIEPKMSEIKPIETHYKGYRFRSRLEARWAVFFDALGVKWEYEAEGYTLKDGSFYLPDFWFPDHKWHGEVKPSGDLITQQEKDKMRLFDSFPPEDENGNLSSLGLLLLVGAPEVPFCNFTKFNEPPDTGGNTWHILTRFGMFHDKEKIKSAVAAARSARFEHGETP